jgi:hypothetical protein
MSRWRCGIGDCEATFDRAEDAVVHQTASHERHECRVCGTVVPEGYFAIRHAFDEHTRAEYVRAYDASSDDVRVRERTKERIEAVADLQDVFDRL